MIGNSDESVERDHPRKRQPRSRASHNAHRWGRSCAFLLMSEPLECVNISLMHRCPGKNNVMGGRLCTVAHPNEMRGCERIILVQPMRQGHSVYPRGAHPRNRTTMPPRCPSPRHRIMGQLHLLEAIRSGANARHIIAPHPMWRNTSGWQFRDQERPRIQGMRQRHRQVRHGLIITRDTSGHEPDPVICG